MQSFELIDDDNDDEYLTTLSNNLSGVEKLWRLTDESEPNYFTLRILKGTLEESVSLLHLLSGLSTLITLSMILTYFFVIWLEIRKKGSYQIKSM